MINKKTMTPKTLQAILIASIIASIIIGAIGFSLIKQFLTSYSTQVSHAIGDSAASANNVETLQTIKKELVTQQSNELKATEVISPIGSYQSHPLQQP
jgi:predicted PurR-regulated permease PerM